MGVGSLATTCAAVTGTGRCSLGGGASMKTLTSSSDGSKAKYRGGGAALGWPVGSSVPGCGGVVGDIHPTQSYISSPCPNYSLTKELVALKTLSRRARLTVESC